MGRTPIHMSVIISSTQDSRFAKPKTFHSIPAVSKATGISLRAVRNAYHSKRTSIRKASGIVYTLEWQEPFIPKDPRECYYCRKTLTVKEKSTWFHMERDDIKELPMGLQDPGPLRGPMTFTSLYLASKITGISDCVLRDACKKTNKKVTKRKGEFARYKIDWFGVCHRCDPSPPTKSKGVVKGYVIPRWDINELFS